jgi:hypothetical protein
MVPSTLFGDSDRTTEGQLSVHYETIRVVALSAAFLIMLFAIVLNSRLHEHLRRMHPSTWVALGQPEGARTSAASQVRMSRFCFLGRFRALRDPVLSRLCWTSVLLTSLIIGLLVVAVIAHSLGHAG